MPRSTLLAASSRCRVAVCLPCCRCRRCRHLIVIIIFRRHIARITFDFEFSCNSTVALVASCRCYVTDTVLRLTPTPTAILCHVATSHQQQLPPSRATHFAGHLLIFTFTFDLLRLFLSVLCPCVCPGCSCPKQPAIISASRLTIAQPVYACGHV